MPISEEDLKAGLDSCYASVLDQSAWPRAMHDLARALGATGEACITDDAGRAAVIQAPRLQLASGLTRGEARVAALIGSGLSPREAAQRLIISEETVRTTLKRVYSKVGVSRQNELAALLTRLVFR